MQTVSVSVLSNCWQNIFEKHHESLVKYIDSDKDLAYFTDGVYDSYEEEFYEAKFIMEEKLESLRIEKSATDRLDGSINGSDEAVTNRSLGQTGHLRLSRIPLPSFNGDYGFWISFRDQFQSMVDDQPNLPAVQKLFYLKASLQGEANNLLKHFQVNEANYGPAWNHLLERYENKRILINTQLKILFTQANITTETSYGIKKLLDTTNETLQQLNNLGVNSDSWDHLLIYMTVQRLPAETHQAWEQPGLLRTTHRKGMPSIFENDIWPEN